MNYPQIYVRTEKTGVLASRHPWVWESSIIEPAISPAVGSIVDLMQFDGTWLGRGIYNPASHIRVRIYQWSPDQPLDDRWLRQRLDIAWQLRQQWQDRHGQLDGLRLVNSEGDGLSGLVIERLGDYAVVQVTAAGVQGWLPAISQWLRDHFQLKGILLRIDEKMAQAENMTSQRTLLWGSNPEGPIEFSENGVRIRLDLEAGQKTGYYLDQRANRLEAATYLRGRMLDVCTYLGGFSLAACRHGRVQSVVALDLSSRALAQAQENAHINGFEQIQFQQADCFEELERRLEAGEVFDSVVLDPPRLAGSREHKSAALRAYHHLNLLAIRLLIPGGTLVTCSCSGRVTREDFLGTLAACARRAGRRLQILQQRGADFDHPWEVACPESEYLKCMICRVI